MNHMRLAVLRDVPWDHPLTSFDIDLVPPHAPDLFPALSGEGQKLDNAAKWVTDSPCRLQNRGQFVVRQHAVTPYLARGRADSGARREFQESPRDTPV